MIKTNLQQISKFNSLYETQNEIKEQFWKVENKEYI